MLITRVRPERPRDGCCYRGPMYALDAVRLACCITPLHKNAGRRARSCHARRSPRYGYPRMSRPTAASCEDAK
jgi:hypothetical protein